MTKEKKSKKTKKSTTKNRKFRVSPLIPIVAVIEVIVLIVVSSYAWFYIQASKVIGSGTISVAADSGLDIDFQYSNIDDYINIWNYVGNDFTFEPATSMDGRMIYFPTSGTFNSTNTRDLVLRDGTINDINSKYLSIDFELTNTSGYDQYVYLNNKSFFKVVDKADENQRQESRALRLAFYANDGNSGNVGSDMLRRSGASDGGEVEENSGVVTHPYTLYFNNASSNWSSVYAHVYKYVDGGSGDVAYTDWPGIEMSRVSGKIYSVTFDNPPDGGDLKYTRVIFNNNNGSQSAKIELTAAKNGKMFTSSSAADAAGSDYTTNTVYFLKPYGWGDNVYCHAWDSDHNAYTTSPGDLMTYVGSGIYSYTYNSGNTGGLLFDNGNMGENNQTVDINFSDLNNNTADDQLFYCTGTKNIGKYNYTQFGTNYSSMSYKTVYLFNTYGWEKPYTTVMVGNSENTLAKADIAMTYLSGNVYYCTVPSVYDQGYFKDKEHNNNNYRTAVEALANQTVYRVQPANALSDGKRSTENFLYANYIKDTGYPVISPGVSAGFQRPYSPVLEIDAYSGAATKIIPAYSNSIDNYILGTGTPLFVLKANHMVSMSMIMWLEGTDEACFGDVYPGNLIDLRLEFSTEYWPNGTQEPETAVIVNPGDSESYIYNFYDRTREMWTSDRQKTESGVTVAPVMQLYDNTTKRGYLMHASIYEDYNGKRKVRCWTVTAPQSIARLGHDIQFRRVNPYNEDEVWNYWHAGPVAGDRNLDANGEFVIYDNEHKQSVYDIALSRTNIPNDTVNFTAFADGSPIKEYMENNYKKKFPSATSEDVSTYLTNASMPNESCGGLWGDHKVRTLTVMDGTDGNSYKANRGIISIKYSFSYKSGTSLAIEYKSSGPNYNTLYYFIVPECFYQEDEGTALVSDVVFKRYYNFNDGYAINSDRNDELLYDRKWDAYTPKGLYYELSQTYKRGENADYYGYWGSDILYIQTTTDTSGTLKTDLYNNRLLRAEFSSTEHDKSFWVQIFANDEFKPDENNTKGTGYPVVVPNDYQYNRYRVHLSKLESGYDSLLYGEYNTLTTSDVSSDASTIDIRNVAYANGASQHICKYWKFYDITIYFETDVGDFNNAEGNGTHNKRAHIYSSVSGSVLDGSYENARKVIWDGQSQDRTKQRYRVTFNPTYYDRVIFWAHWDNPYHDAKFEAITVTPFDKNRIYSGWKEGNNCKTSWTQYTISNTEDPKWVLHSDAYSAEGTSWPHYSAANAS